MYEQIREDILFIIFYTLVTGMAMMASCYLLFRGGNAFAPDITPPVRLRRWTAAFFAAIALCHLWYLPTYFLSSSDDRMLGYLIAGLLDCMTAIPLAIVVLLVMLQDRRRPLWPVCAMVMPLIVGRAWCVATRSEDLLLVLFTYFTLMSITLVIYMVRATRQYGRWLRDNFADLEHKEVWQNFVVLAVILLTFAVYSFDIGGLVYEYAMEMNVIILICYLLWRVETLSDLSIPINDMEEETVTTEDMEDNALSLSLSNNIGLLLKQYCEEPQLYLQHDLNLIQLAKAIGTNRLYLSQYLSSQGMNFNNYINNLRINHFVSLYYEVVAAQRHFTAQQLALESGFSNYRTFSNAFKRKTEQPVTVWMKAASKQEQSQACLDSAGRKQARPKGKTQHEGHGKS